MSIPLDRLYHYIEQTAQAIRCDDVVIYRFTPHGSKKITDLWPLRNIPWPEWPVCAHVYCYDQEPLNYEMYQDQRQDIWRYQDWALESPKQNIRAFPGDIYDKCVLVHSEQRSTDLTKYQQDQFIPVYYWSHAIIARDWFRYAKHCAQRKQPKHRFLVYNRAWTGTREYRLKFADLLIDYGLVDHCVTACAAQEPELRIHYQQHKFQNPAWQPVNVLEDYLPTSTAASHYSADFDQEDYSNTDIEVVLETLFDDERLHLTEKSLRPIACGQPFILTATHGSLAYLRRYGFQTFSDIWDESYDTIIDPVERLQAVIKLMKTIANWTEPERLSNLAKVQHIVDHNKQHFFSDCFFEQIVSELKTNLVTAFDELESTNTSQRFFAQRKALVSHNQARKFITGADCAETRQGILQVIKTAKSYQSIGSILSITGSHSSPGSCLTNSAIRPCNAP